MKNSRNLLSPRLLALALLLPLPLHAFYNPATGRWLSRDPLGARGDNNLYCFVLNSALTHVDKLGQITVHLDKERSEGKTICGGYYYIFPYSIDNYHAEPGYIVQRVSIFEDWDKCHPLLPWFSVRHRRSIEFWEHFETKPDVQPGHIVLDDHSSEPRHIGTRGSQTVYGEARWYPKSITGELSWLPGEYTKHASYTKPDWWERDISGSEINGEPVAWRNIKTVWNCCCPELFSQAIYVSPSH